MASVDPEREEVSVYRGRLVEANTNWLCEAVWTGEFDAGNFDRTPLVFGSGIRLRKHSVNFVSAGSTVDRLWVWTSTDGDQTLISNSLVTVLSGADVRPRTDHRQYHADLQSVVNGLQAYRRTLPVTEGKLEVVYFDNLVWDGAKLSRIEKPRLERTFSSYGDYRTFLSETAQALSANARSTARQEAVRLLTTISSGYDSPAVSVIAREMGCNQAVTIRQARSLIPRSDSGARVGEALGLDTVQYDRDQAIGPSELRYWAAMGKPQDVNLGIFDYPEPVCLLMTGFHGDKMWTTEEHDTSDQIVRGDTTGLGFTEDRLYRGVLHCPLPYWGVRKMDEIDEITQSSEMEPWRLHNDYDRPIPRRIVEEEGVPREYFGQQKSATSSDWRRLFPYTRELRRDYAIYAENCGGTATPVSLKAFQSTVERFLSSVEARWPILGDYLPTIAPDVPALQFHWAIDRLRYTIDD